MSLTVDLSAFRGLTARIAELRDSGSDAIMRTVAVTMAAEVRERIHERGEKADGSQIGTYTPEYMKVRKRARRTEGTKIILSFTGQMENDLLATELDPVKIENGYAIGLTNETNKVKANAIEFGRSAGNVSAHKRVRKGKEENVSAHQRSGTKGYGSIYALQEKELVKVDETLKYEVNKFFNK